jgi:hypothetical protein
LFFFDAAMRAPDFTKKPQSVTAPLDQDAVFEVEVDGEPLPEVKWFKDGIEIRPTPKYRFKDDGNKFQLVVKGVDELDGGEITCELSNPKGKETAAATLKVQGTHLQCPFVFLLMSKTVPIQASLSLAVT